MQLCPPRSPAPGWTYGAPMASNLALLTRFYERLGDQAVSVPRWLEFAATGGLLDAT